MLLVGTLTDVTSWGGWLDLLGFGVLVGLGVFGGEQVGGRRVVLGWRVAHRRMRCTRVCTSSTSFEDGSSQHSRTSTRVSVCVLARAWCLSTSCTYSGVK